MKQQVIEWLDRFDESQIAAKVDEAMLDFIDDDWNEDGEYESKYDWYVDHGNKEAESQVRTEIEQEILAKFGTTYEKYELETGECLWDTINEKHDILE